jgi:hypothetical protein
MLTGIAHHSISLSENSHLMSSNDLLASGVSMLWNSLYCFDSQGYFMDYDWDQNIERRSFLFDSRVLDSCENRHGLFVLTEDMKIYQNMGNAGVTDQHETPRLNFQVIANFDSELTQEKTFTKMRSYLDDFLLISIGTFFVLFGICEAKANMIDLGGVVRTFDISESLHQAVLLVNKQAVVLSLKQNKVMKKVDVSCTLKAISIEDNLVVMGGFNKKILQFKLERNCK